MRYVGQASARLVVVMTPSGQVLAQHGFARAVDLMSAAALGAAIMASSGALAEQLGERSFDLILLSIFRRPSFRRIRLRRQTL